MAKALPIDDRIVLQSAKATITNLIDGIVELVTNSNESYLELEERGAKTEGLIEIYVNRKKGGICEKLIVKDYAEGMLPQRLLDALKFGGKTGRFWSGKSGRSLWGRGLKETIISLGEGEIKTIHDGKLSKTKIWVDTENEIALYDEEFLNKLDFTNEHNGTEITVYITNNRIKIPETENFIKQIRNHYELRNINSSISRRVKLTFEELTPRSKSHGPPTTAVEIKFIQPEGENRLRKDQFLPNFGDRIKISIFESKKPLEFQRYSPFGRAGFLIKTEKAILDNQLFKFDNDPVGLYFFGEVLCCDLEKRIRDKKQTDLLDFNRCGLNWRHPYCQILSKTVEEVLEPYILKKKKELSQNKPSGEVKETTKRMFRRLANFLNEIAKKELGEDTDRPPEPPPDINELVIIPPYPNVQINKPRTLSIVAPTNIIDKEGALVRIESDNINIKPSVTQLNLEKSQKYPNILWSKYFKVFAYRQDETGTITAKLGSKSASVKIKVAPPKDIGPRPPKKGGFISDFRPDDGSKTGENMRARYEKESALVYININFPSISKFIGEGLKGIETSEGRVLLSEVVGEVFFRQLAIDALEKEGYIRTGEPLNIIQDFNSRVNNLQKKYLYKIQEIIFNWKF